MSGPFRAFRFPCRGPEQGNAVQEFVLGRMIDLTFYGRMVSLERGNGEIEIPIGEG